VRGLRELGGEVVPFHDPFNPETLIGAVHASQVILDGILGTGFKLPMRGKLPALLSLITAYSRDKVVIAVDCPSGVDCDSGDSAPETLQADLTICMAAMKQGMIKQPAIGMMGEIILADIGLPENAFDLIENKVNAADGAYVKSLLPERPSNAHKGTFGKCLVIGGSVPYPGAPTLAAEAAYRVGVGLVCTAIPSTIYDGLISRLPESTWLMLPHEMGMLNDEAAKILLQHLGRYNTILIGPGMGSEKATEGFIHNLLDTGKHKANMRPIGFISESDNEESSGNSLPAMVIDADGLRILAGIEDWPNKLKRKAVLTPHPGEMAALTGLTIKEVQQDRVAIAQQSADRWGHVMVLKGALTVVASPDEAATVIPIATSALATAGTGDLLAGMIAGLMAQGMDAYDAAISASWLHGVAGLNAERIHGQGASVLARDIIDQIPNALKKTTAQ